MSKYPNPLSDPSPEQTAETSSKPPYLDKVFIGDARSMLHLPNCSVNLVITSPPYFSIKDYSKDGHQLETHSEKNLAQLGDLSNFDHFINELLKVWRECERVLKPNGKLVINTPLVPMLKKDLTTHENRHVFDLNSEIQRSILQALPNIYLLDTYIWNRTNPSKKLMFGSYPFPTNFYAQNTIEFVTVYVKGGKAEKVSEERKSKSRLTQAEWVEFTKQVWNIPIPNKSDKAFGLHSALMPEEIVRRCVRLYSFHDDLILDPFAGSGTTLKVAQDLERHFVGYEIVSTYASIINDKIGKEVCEVVKTAKTKIVSPEHSLPPQFLDKLLLQDAIKYLKLLPQNSVPLACIDPPYNLGKGDWDTWNSPADFYHFTQSWLREVVRVLRPGASLYVFNTPYNCAKILQFAEREGMVFQNWITWDKRDGFAPSKRRFVQAQESILFLTKPGKPHTFNAESVRIPYDSTERIAAAAKTGILKNGKRWFPNEHGKLCPDVWHISSARHKSKVRGRIEKSPHPTEKPVELIERMILASSHPGDAVLDCFMGLGTTAVAALRNGRHFLGCEKDDEFMAHARERIAAATTEIL